MKSHQQQLREAAVVAGCTVVWTAVGVVSFDRMPELWFQQSAASFAPATGRVVAAWFLPIAILILFVAGWVSTLGLVFQVLRWRVRDDEEPVGAARANEQASDESSLPVHDATDRLG